MEAASGKDLSAFFSQWLYKGGHPKIRASWHYDSGSKTLSIELDQEQSGQIFGFPLEIGVGTGSSQEVKSLRVDKKSQSFKIEMAAKPSQITLDPNTWLLFEGEIREK
jgi:aminopeptidase N